MRASSTDLLGHHLHHCHQRRRGRLRLSRAAAALLVPVFVALLVPGCYWLRHDDLMRTHVELVSGLAADAGASVASGRRVSDSDLRRMVYPLTRARRFVEVALPNSGERESMKRFESLLDRYEQLTKSLDRMRIAADPAQFRPGIQVAVAAIAADAEAVLTALDQESP